MQNSDNEQINIPYPEENELHLKIAIGACRLRIRPSEGEYWVTGTYHDSSRSLPVRITQEGGSVKITQAHDWAKVFDLLSSVPTFELAIGKAKPFVLTFETGASENDIDLGGLPINRLVIKQGAGKLTFDFSAPNPQAMGQMSIGAGAGSVELTNLANANFTEMTADGGAVAYKLDFGGVLTRDAYVKISTGMSSVDIRVPASTAAKISTQSTMGSLDVGDGLMKKEGAFWTNGALSGKSPLLSIYANVALGSLSLRTA